MALALFLYTVVCVGLLLHAWLAFSITGIVGGYAGSFYWFTIPHLLLVPLSAVMVALHAILRKEGTLTASFLCLSCLLLTWLYAGAHWPGGDDGPGMAWIYGVGLASVLSTALGMPLVWLAHRIARSRLLLREPLAR